MSGYLIWSHEHEGWWLPNRDGYTTKRDDAGRYSLTTAQVICDDANKHAGDQPEETMCPDWEQ